MPTTRVKPGKGGYTDYTDDRLGISEYDSDQMENLTEESFYAKGSIEDGCSGKKAIDTRYENTSEDRATRMRSDRDDPVIRIVNERISVIWY